MQKKTLKLCSQNLFIKVYTLNHVFSHAEGLQSPNTAIYKHSSAVGTAQRYDEHLGVTINGYLKDNT